MLKENLFVWFRMIPESVVLSLHGKLKQKRQSMFDKFLSMEKYEFILREYRAVESYSLEGF